MHNAQATAGQQEAKVQLCHLILRPIMHTQLDEMHAVLPELAPKAIHLLPREACGFLIVGALHCRHWGSEIG